ncbi:MAG: CheR family methyltransferase [Sphingomonadaceae bacterium]
MASQENQIVPVVGVGASAGGLEALREMFRGCDGLPGMAFVVVQHLDPNHESLMAQLIERYTEMEVTQAEGGEQLTRDHIYVIPPGHGLAVEKGVLQLTEFTDPRGLRRPIDDFFESLSKDREHLGACVILSGTGADGSRGLRAVKEQGGLAIAQDPATARYDGMPVSAIGTGLVDMVCKPEAIIDRLRQFFDPDRPLHAPEDEAAEVVDHVDDLCEVLRETIGHDFSGYKRSTLTRRIARRMQVLGLTDASKYLTRIRKDSGECDALFRDLLINVTRFFRDTEDFDRLRDMVIDPLVRNARDGQEVRIWVAGCSSGEEAYSIAMLLADAMHRHDAQLYVQVFATDIDDKMLQIARSGTYPISALVDIPTQFQADYIIAGTETFTIAPRLRDMVRFSQHNLVRDPPFSNIDLVSCRNVLIYFGEALQKQVIPLFHFALRSSTGYLFLGSSEAIGRFDDLFECLNQPARLFKRKNVKSRYSLQIPSSTSASMRRRAIVDEERQKSGSGSAELSALRRIAESYAPVSLLTDQDGILLERWGNAGKFLKFPERLDVNVHVPSLARTGLREVVGPMLREVHRNNRRTIARNINVHTDFGTLTVAVVCEPVGEDSYLLVIRETEALKVYDDGDFEEFESGDGQIEFLEQELQSTRYRLRSTVEELETTNEELKSSNEEMMSMNEELQSTNEELTTVNDELKTKVDQITVANADLRNFFDSTELVVIVVDSHLQVRSYTDSASELFTIDEGDIGRNLGDIGSNLDSREYIDLASKAARQNRSFEYHTTSADGEAEYVVKAIPYRTMSGDVDGATLVFTEVTRLLRLETSLSQERERLRLALDVAQIGVWEYDPTTDRTTLDATEKRLLGLDENDDNPSLQAVLETLPAEDRDNINQSLRQAMDGEVDFDEVFRVPLSDGNYRWLHGLGRRINAGETRKFIGVTYDVTAEHQHMAQRELMIREMNHRVKNLFAVISAMINISSKDAEDVEEFATELRDRIHALGRSHALTNASPEDRPATLKTLIETVLKGQHSTQKVTLSGPEVEVSKAQTTSLALIFHEWATNSSKYGAFSQSDGSLDVSWRQADDMIVVDWVEKGRGDVEDNVAGFGTRLVDLTARQLQGEAKAEPTDGGYWRELTFKPAPAD